MKRRIRFIQILAIIHLFFLGEISAQSELVSWPLTSDYETIVYNGSAFESVEYSFGTEMSEILPFPVDGGIWKGATKNNSHKRDEYVQVALNNFDDAESSVYLTSMSFEIKHIITGSGASVKAGPRNYIITYLTSAFTEFENETVLGEGVISDVAELQTLNFTNPITIASGEFALIRIYAYDSEAVDGEFEILSNTFNIDGYVENTSGIKPVDKITFSQKCENTGDVSFQLPFGFDPDFGTVLIFAKEGSPILYGELTNPLNAYSITNTDLSTSEGSPLEYDPDAQLVFKGSEFTITELTNMSANIDYYFLAVIVESGGGPGNYSPKTYENGLVTGTVLDLEIWTAVGLNNSVKFDFEAPNCVDAVMIVAKGGSEVTLSPSGDGSAYFPDSSFTGSGTAFDGGKVVYNQTISSFENGKVEVINLTVSTDIHFTMWVRKGETWSEGIALIRNPNMSPVAFTQVQSYSITSDFVEFITMYRVDLSGYSITDQGVCESGAIYRYDSSISDINPESEKQDFFSNVGNPDIPAGTFIDVPGGTYVRVYTGESEVELDLDYSDGLITLINSNLKLNSIAGGGIEEGDQVLIYRNSLPGGFEDCNLSPNPIVSAINFGTNENWIENGDPDRYSSYRPNTNFAYATKDSEPNALYQNDVDFFNGADSSVVFSNILDHKNWDSYTDISDGWILKEIKFQQSDFNEEVEGAEMNIDVFGTTFILDASLLQFIAASISTRYMVVVNEIVDDESRPTDLYTCYNSNSNYSEADSIVSANIRSSSDVFPCDGSKVYGTGRIVYFDYDLPTDLNVTGLKSCTTYRVGVYAVNGNGYTSNFGDPAFTQVTTDSDGSSSLTYFSQSSGNFSDPIWSPEPLGSPIALNELNECVKIFIQNTHVVSLDTLATFGDLEVESGGEFKLGENRLNILGDIIVNGSFIGDQGTLEIGGSHGTQEIHFENEGVVIKNFVVFERSLIDSNFVLVHNSFSIANIMQVLQGNIVVDPGVFIRLISDSADYAAALGRIPSTSSITGDFLIERFLPDVSTIAPPNSGNGVGWRYLSAPITSASFDQWDDDFFTSGLLNSQDPEYPYNIDPSYYYFPSLQFYDETVEGDQQYGFDGDYDTIAGPPTIRVRRDIFDSVSPGQGVFAYLGPVPLTFDAQGTPFTGDLSINLSYTDNGLPSEDGWNLVANPYPCAIDWRSVKRTEGVSPFAYIYDVGEGQFVILQDSLSLGEQLIASSNAFWVKVEEEVDLEVQQIKFEERNKSYDVNASFHKNELIDHNTMLVFIHNVSDSSLHDFTFLRFFEEASKSFDYRYDAQKKYSLNFESPGLVTMIDTEDFAINSLNPSDTIISIPLKAVVQTPGSYQLNFKRLGSYFNGICMVLNDLELDSQIVITPGITYDFYSDVKSVNDTPRFELIVTPTVQVETTRALCNGGSNGSAVFSAYGEGPFIYTLYDADGMLISSEIAMNEYELNELSYGFYSMVVSGLTGTCSDVEREFFIGQPANSIEPLTAFGNTLCEGSSGGYITVNIMDSVYYNVVLYKDNIINAVKNNVNSNYTFNNLVNGNYQIEILNECDTFNFNVEILVTDPLTVDYILPVDTIYLQDGGEIFLENTSVNASFFSWIFDPDQLEPFTEVDGVYTYTEAGSYDIELIGYTVNGCEDFQSQTLVVVDLSIDIEEIENGIIQSYISYSNGTPQYVIELNEAKIIQVQLLNTMGQVLDIQEVNVNGKTFVDLPVDNISSGVYLVITLDDGTKIDTQKLFVK